MLKPHQNRNQLQMISLESMVDKNSIVRLIDVFVDLIDLEDLGFIVKGKINNGAPAFHAADLLKLYYYGYSNRVRSSRRLERETKINMEAIWLIKGTQPSYKTIADFRKDNLKPLKKVFKTYNRFLLEQDLLKVAFYFVIVLLTPISRGANHFSQIQKNKQFDFVKI